MTDFADVIVIGAGVLGCFTARALSAYNLKTIVLEKREDVCTMISKANTGIVYAGYDMRPGSLKAKMTVKANKAFPDLCKELGVAFSICGSLMVSYGPNGDASLERKMEQGIKSQVPGLRLLSGQEAEQMEPHLRKGITRALYSETTGAVTPWELGIAAYENARSNGVSFHFEEEVTTCRCDQEEILLRTTKQQYSAKVVINCAGSDASHIRELAFPKSIGILHSRANYLVYEAGKDPQVSHIIFHEPEDKNKALTIVPTIDHHLIIGATETDSKDGPSYATEMEDLDELFSFVKEMLPEMDQQNLLHQFGSARPNPYQYNDPSAKLSDFNITEDDRMISLIGIKTPGITCACELGKYVAKKATQIIGTVEQNPTFDPVRKPLEGFSVLHYNSKVDGPILCTCNLVTEKMVRDAIHRGAVTLNGIRRRTGAGMGRCQGAECEEAILKILAKEMNLPVNKVTKDGYGSELIQ